MGLSSVFVPLVEEFDGIDEIFYLDNPDKKVNPEYNCQVMIKIYREITRHPVKKYFRTTVYDNSSLIKKIFMKSPTQYEEDHPAPDVNKILKDNFKKSHKDIEKQESIMGRLLALGAFEKGRTCMSPKELSLVVTSILVFDIIEDNALFIQAFLLHLYDPISAIFDKNHEETNEDTRDSVTSASFASDPVIYYNNIFFDFIHYTYSAMLKEFRSIFLPLFSNRPKNKKSISNAFLQTYLELLKLEKLALKISTDVEMADFVNKAYDYARIDDYNLFIGIPLIHAVISANLSNVKILAYPNYLPKNLEQKLDDIAKQNLNGVRQSNFRILEEMNRQIFTGSVPKGAVFETLYQRMINDSIICRECYPHILPIFQIVKMKRLV